MRRRGRIAPFGIAVAAVLLSLGLIYLSGAELDFSPEDVRLQTQPQENAAAPRKQEGNDMGMVLLDIPTRQAALAFHVPGVGVYVLAVAKNGPADRAGIQPGDRIAGVKGVEIDGAEGLADVLGALKDGEAVDLIIIRGMERLMVTLTLEAEPERL